MKLERFREFRQMQGLTQEQVAQKLGITKQQYQLYESGKRDIKLDKLIKFCKVFKVSADWLLEIGEDKDNEI